MKTLLFILINAAVAFVAGYVVAAKKEAKVQSALSPKIEWLDDWITLTIPFESFMSIERPICDKDVLEIDLNSGKNITLSPQLCRDKPKASLDVFCANEK